MRTGFVDFHLGEFSTSMCLSEPMNKRDYRDKHNKKSLSVSSHMGLNVFGRFANSVDLFLFFWKVGVGRTVHFTF